MKNTIYAIVIAVCILGAVLVFMNRRSASGGGVNSLADSQKTWVKCAKCSQSYEMGLKQYYKDVEDKAKANPSPMPMTMPLTRGRSVFGSVIGRPAGQTRLGGARGRCPRGGRPSGCAPPGCRAARGR